MGKWTAIFLVMASAALAQSTGGNYQGKIRTKLFRNLTTNPRGLFHNRPDLMHPLLLAPKETAPTVTVPGTSANCVIGLLEVPTGSRGHIDSPIFVPLLPNQGGDPGMIIAPTLPTCPARK